MKRVIAPVCVASTIVLFFSLKRYVLPPMLCMYCHSLRKHRHRGRHQRPLRHARETGEKKKIQAVKEWENKNGRQRRGEGGGGGRRAVDVAARSESAGEVGERKRMDCTHGLRDGRLVP